MKIINRPWWWVILLFLPIVNLIMLPVIWVETARSFGKNSNIDTLLAVVTFGFYNYINVYILILNLNFGIFLIYRFLYINMIFNFDL